MPPRRPPRPNPPDVDALRAGLAQGKLVRVGIAPSGQFPDGVTGRVRRIGDPAVDGEEFIFVEVPVGGAKDVLPFAAADLIGPPSRKPAARAVPATAGPVRVRATADEPTPRPHGRPTLTGGFPISHGRVGRAAASTGAAGVLAAPLGPAGAGRIRSAAAGGPGQGPCASSVRIRSPAAGGIRV